MTLVYILLGLLVVAWIWIAWEYNHPYQDDDYDM